MIRTLSPLATLICFGFGMAGATTATEPPPQPQIGKLPHIEFDPKNKRVRIECEMLAVDAPLEFLCCVKGFNDYEALVRSEVKPSHLHLALLAIGLKQGQPLRYSQAAQKWFPPSGPPLQISMEYQKDGKTLIDPAWKWLRDVHSKKAAPPMTWVFVGSGLLPDGKYAADVTGYLVSIVNFALAVVDVPELASSSNELLEWERNADVTPKAGTTVWMILEPVGNQPANRRDAKPATRPAAPASGRSDSDLLESPVIPSSAAPAPPPPPASADAEVSAAEKRVKQLRDLWDQKVAPHRDVLRDAAEAHYQVLQGLRMQQQKLIDEADHIQRTIEELEKQYQDLTTPRPESNK